MAVVKVLASEFDIAIESATPDTFTDIKGITELSISTTKNDIDTRDFDSGGWLEHIVGSRGKSFTINGRRLEDTADGTRDPGQAAVEVLGDEMGADAIGNWQITSPGGVTYTFGASADVNPFGGGLDANANWSVTLTMSGEWAIVEPGDGDGDG